MSVLRRSGRHIARRWFAGVAIGDVALTAAAVLFAGGVLAGTMVAQRTAPVGEPLHRTTLTAPPPATSATTRPGGTATSVTLPPGPGPPGPPGQAGVPGPPGAPGSAVTVPMPVPTVTTPPTTLPVPPPPTVTTRPCRPPPSHPHPTTTQKPCLKER